MDKFCTRCESTLTTLDFYKCRSRSDGLQAYCKKCTSAATAKSRNWRATMIDEFKAQPCRDCGVSYPPFVMDCDHLPGTGKEHDLSRLKNNGSQSKIERELAKCEAVCSNCHRARTERRRLAA